EDEVEDIDIEISVLGAPQPLRSAEDIEIGVHGLSIEHEDRRGLLLPQVATKNGLDARSFLAEVCRKAGLPEDAWKQPGAVVYMFPAQVFDDDSHPPLESLTLH
ncbi:MAG TPA: AMMECR1 domain-containing protein, partial [Haliangium sp.]|nr:AMMECR1 domain-containing protein [Haliangium sp.]